MRLRSSTTSGSTTMRSAMPIIASDSASHEPVPPAPISSARVLRTRSCAEATSMSPRVSCSMYARWFDHSSSVSRCRVDEQPARRQRLDPLGELLRCQVVARTGRAGGALHRRPRCRRRPRGAPPRRRPHRRSRPSTRAAVSRSAVSPAPGTTLTPARSRGSCGTRMARNGRGGWFSHRMAIMQPFRERRHQLGLHGSSAYRLKGSRI